jgi:hypothetical protein
MFFLEKHNSLLSRSSLSKKNFFVKEAKEEDRLLPPSIDNNILQYSSYIAGTRLHSVMQYVW